MRAVSHSDDNAVCEGFFGTLRPERVHSMKYPTFGNAKVDVFDYIERFLNPLMRRRVAKHDLKY